MSSLTALWAYHMLLELTVMTKPKPNQSKKDPGPRSPNPLPAYRPTPKTHRIKHLLLMLPTETTAGKMHPLLCFLTSLNVSIFSWAYLVQTF